MNIFDKKRYLVLFMVISTFSSNPIFGMEKLPQEIHSKIACNLIKINVHEKLKKVLKEKLSKFNSNNILNALINGLDSSNLKNLVAMFLLTESWNNIQELKEILPEIVETMCPDLSSKTSIEQFEEFYQKYKTFYILFALWQLKQYEKLEELLKNAPSSFLKDFRIPYFEEIVSQHDNQLGMLMLVIFYEKQIMEWKLEKKLESKIKEA